MNKKMIEIFDEHFSWMRNSFLGLIGLNLTIFIVHKIFPSHAGILMIAWMTIFIINLLFFRNSFLPMISNTGEIFSWKFLQGLPLKKSELILLIVSSALVVSIPLWSYLFLVHETLRHEKGFESLKALELLKLTANYILIIITMSLISIMSRIQRPRIEFQRNNKNMTLNTIKYALAIVAFLMYSSVALFLLRTNYNINVMYFVDAGIEKFQYFVVSWWFPVALALFIHHAFHTTLNLWKNEKSAYRPQVQNLKKEWGIVVVLAALIIYPLSKNDLSTPSMYSGSALNKAVYEKNYAEIDRLLKLGKNINSASYFGFTPMFVAIHEGNFTAVKFLEARGANFKGILKNELEYHDHYDALLLAIDGKNKEIVEYVLEKGFEVNGVLPELGYTPIHLASARCSPELVDLLIQKGANIESLNRNGETPALVAIKNNCASAVVTLKEQGARFDIANSKGKKAVDYPFGKNKELEYLVNKYSREPASSKKSSETFTKVHNQ